MKRRFYHKLSRSINNRHWSFSLVAVEPSVNDGSQGSCIWECRNGYWNRNLANWGIATSMHWIMHALMAGNIFKSENEGRSGGEEHIWKISFWRFLYCLECKLFNKVASTWMHARTGWQCVQTIYAQFKSYSRGVCKNSSSSQHCCHATKQAHNSNFRHKWCSLKPPHTYSHTCMTTMLYSDKAEQVWKRVEHPFLARSWDHSRRGWCCRLQDGGAGWFVRRSSSSAQGGTEPWEQALSLLLPKRNSVSVWLVNSHVSLLALIGTFRYLSGGVESGFKKVEKDKYEPRLLHVKGRRNIRVQQTKLAWGSMNSGDVFILDLGLEIYVWNGKESGRLEKIKGLDVARRIRDEERGGRASLDVVGMLQ